MFDDYHEMPQPAKNKKIKIYRNGDSSRSFMMEIPSNYKFNSLRKDVEDKLNLNNIKKLRLFTNQGVEIFEDDMDFIKEGTALYVSKGEDFNQNSCFSEYEIVKTLGEGGFGKVVLGIHKSTKEKVAIKIVNTGLIGTAQDIDMVFREAEMLKALRHKHIVVIKNTYTLHNMQVIFIMEYLEGGELLNYVQDKGGLAEDEAKIFFKQLVSAMIYCHQEKLIHRDLKLENILLTSKDSKHIKVVDFGIAGVSSNFSLENASAGSFRYMAPEVLNKKQRLITQAVDVWAMGVILYGMIFCNLPFNGASTKIITDKIIACDYSLPPDKPVSKEFKDILNQMLRLDPGKRMSCLELSEHPWLLSNSRITPQTLHITHEEVEEEKDDSKNHIEAPKLTPREVIAIAIPPNKKISTSGTPKNSKPLPPVSVKLITPLDPKPIIVPLNGKSVSPSNAKAITPLIPKQNMFSKAKSEVFNKKSSQIKIVTGVGVPANIKRAKSPSPEHKTPTVLKPIQEKKDSKKSILKKK